MDGSGRAHGLRSAPPTLLQRRRCRFNGRSSETHLIPLILDVALGRGPAVEVFGSDYRTRDDTAIRDYVHVSDLARAHVPALNRLVSGGGSFAVNLASGQGASAREVIDATRAVTGRLMKVHVAPRRHGDPPMFVADARGPASSWPGQRNVRISRLAMAWQWLSDVEISRGDGLAIGGDRMSRCGLPVSA
jgi:UDP-glucose 4-epimerase